MPQRRTRQRSPRRIGYKDIISKSTKEAYKDVNLSSKEWFSNMWFAFLGAVLAIYMENLYAGVKQLNLFWFGAFLLFMYFVFVFLSFIGLTISNIFKEYQRRS